MGVDILCLHPADFARQLCRANDTGVVRHRSLRFAFEPKPRRPVAKPWHPLGQSNDMARPNTLFFVGCFVSPDVLGSR